jgi:hypothetical protein
MLTINQHPVVAADYGDRPDRSVESQLAALASEIAERLEEMEQIKEHAGGVLVNKLGNVRSISPPSFRIIIQLLHGNTAALSSFGHQAASRGLLPSAPNSSPSSAVYGSRLSKQTVYLEMSNEMAKVRRIFPLVVEHFESLRANALAHEDPMSNSDAIREGREATG